MEKDYTEKEAKEIFDKALELSKNVNTLYLGAIAYDLQVPKKLFFELADKYESLKYTLDLIVSNCEAQIFKQMKFGQLDHKLGMLTLESQHGWNRDDPADKAITIKVEGVSNDELDDLLNEGNDGV